MYHSLSKVVTVGLLPRTSLVEESESILVCAQLMSGSLEREVYVQLVAEDYSATCKNMGHLFDNNITMMTYI